MIEINFTELKERMLDDEEILKEVLAVFCEEAPGLYTELAQSVEASDYHQLSHAAHSLKGVCLNLSADSTQKLAYQLELMGKEYAALNSAPNPSQIEALQNCLHLFNQHYSAMVQEVKTYLNH
ncbi:MAG: Hpt domain-containing protein [Cyanobacteria bacterium]|nr:Hpt domain-containing protein [Cyanobacteriota bacterium]